MAVLLGLSVSCSRLARQRAARHYIGPSPCSTSCLFARSWRSLACTNDLDAVPSGPDDGAARKRGAGLVSGHLRVLPPWGQDASWLAFRRFPPCRAPRLIRLGARSAVLAPAT